MLLINVYVYTIKVWNEFYGCLHINEGLARCCLGCVDVEKLSEFRSALKVEFCEYCLLVGVSMKLYMSTNIY